MRQTALLLLFSLTALCLSAQNYPMSDTTIVTCGGWFWDDGLDGAMSDNAYTMTIKSASGRPIALNFYEFDYSTPFVLNVFDGCDTQAPSLGYVGVSPVQNIIPGSVVSTGPCLTLQLYAGPLPPTPSAHSGWKAEIRCLQEMDGVDFRGIRLPNRRDLVNTSVNAPLSNLAVADYDLDGDEDFVLRDSVYRNDTPSDTSMHFTERFNLFGNWNNASPVAADFDQDGDTDVFISGWYNGLNSSASRSILFEQVNKDDFRPIAFNFAPASEGQSTVQDIDSDGDMDIAYTGNTPNGLTFKIYRNNGNMQFTDITPSNVKGARSSGLNWADADGDGDLDFVIGGITDNANVAGVRVGIKNGNNFTIKDLLPVHYLQMDVHFFDYDTDGDKDIYVGDFTRTIFLNDGAANFTPLADTIAFPFAPITFSTFLPKDYDGDGDEDVLLCGGSGPFYLYKNLGNAHFQLIPVPGAMPGFDNDAAWDDYNGDGKPDFYVQGVYNNRSALFLNRGNDIFEKSAIMSGFVEYSHCVSADFTNDGRPELLCTGIVYPCTVPVQSLIYEITNNKTDTERQPVFTPVAHLSGVENISVTNWEWGDYNNDNRPDLLLHSPSNFSVYRNNGNNTFSQILIENGTGALYVSAAWVDMDNDNDLDIYVGRGNYPAFYKNNGSGQFTFYQQPNAPYIGEGFSVFRSCSWTDVDLDGDRDLVEAYQGSMHILLNDGTGKLTLDPDFWEGGLELRHVLLDDFNADSYPDCFVTQQSGSTIAENCNDDLYFGKMPPLGLVSSGNFNNDNLPDLVAPIINNSFNYIGMGPLVVWLNQGGYMFQRDTLSLSHHVLDFCDYALMDYDNDGDTDILSYSEFGSCHSIIVAQNTTNLARRLQVQFPNGSEQLLTGTTATLQWTGHRLHDNGVSSVHLSYSLDCGLSYTDIGDIPTGPEGGSYQWPVPETQSQECLLRVESPRNGLRDHSNFRFTITDVLADKTPVQALIPLQITPNPASSECTLSALRDLGTVTITIRDTWGRMVYQHINNQLNKNTPIVVPVKTWVAGVYFVEVKGKEGVWTKTIIKNDE